MAGTSTQGRCGICGGARDAEPSLGIRLLADIQTVFRDADQMPTKALLRGLIELEESPWGDLKGKPLDERGLARRLRQYGIKSNTVRVGSRHPEGLQPCRLSRRLGALPAPDRQVRNKRNRRNNP